MGVRLIVGDGRESDNVALYDSVTGWAFGPVFPSEDEAQEFLDFLPIDARTYSDQGLSEMYGRFVESRKAGSSANEAE